MRHARFKIRNTKDEPRTTSHEAPVKAGLTLLEMVIVVAVIVILASMVIGIATNIDNQSRKQLTEGTISILNSALQQFQDFGYHYKDSPNYDNPIKRGERDFYLSLKFPLDCNNLQPMDVAIILTNALCEVPAGGIGGNHDPNFSGIAAMYFILSRVPQCRQTLDRIDGSLLTNKGSNGQPITFEMGRPLNREVYPFYRVLDAWKTPLRYDYYYEDYYKSLPVRFDLMKNSIRTFPLITSAGPDKLFGTADDITNNK